ncbi:ABC transporter permease [Rhizobium sp. CCGE 510]|uniref:ABC transporter permease n=1 Tax=Rhizobium sp. CCGE 510 TaxID=1132836 RepID=UPI00027B817B|nr:ABC transporter permease [Rhizobium sp. CCGE 510]EJT04258.1 spermidine/putrescine transport system permease protein [Rhizobium sp. CCGE 510]
MRMFRNLLAYSYLTVAYAFIFLPVVVLVLFSFQDGRLPIPPFKGPTLRWYGEIFSDHKLMTALGNSLMVACTSSAVACTLGFLAAYALARYHLPGSAVQRVLLVIPMTLSYLVIALGLLVLWNDLGLPLSLLSVGVGHVVINLPLCFSIIYASMGDHQKNIERAARDLGASEIKVLLYVAVPMAFPSIFAAYFLSVTFSWDEFIIAFMLSRFDVTLPVEIWSMLRSGLNPKTNAIGSLVFLGSIALVAVCELLAFKRSYVK